MIWPSCGRSSRQRITPSTIMMAAMTSQNAPNAKGSVGDNHKLMNEFSCACSGRSGK
jgi:hypothetical protein